jgi:hypothetical protein
MSEQGKERDKDYGPSAQGVRAVGAARSGLNRALWLAVHERDEALEALGDLASVCPPHIMDRYRELRRERRAQHANASRPEVAPNPALAPAPAANPSEPGEATA